MMILGNYHAVLRELLLTKNISPAVGFLKDLDRCLVSHYECTCDEPSVHHIIDRCKEI